MGKSPKILAWSLLVVGIWMLGYWSSVSIGSSLFQHAKDREFSEALRVSTPDRWRYRNPAEGSLIGKLTIPRLGLSTIVIEGVSARDLKLAAGHIPGTALPGEAGNIAIAAHRDTFFRPLRLIRKNDAITFMTTTGAMDYRVISTEVVNPDNVAALNPTGTDTLTLVTCFPFNFIGPAPKRFIVRAEKW